MIYYLAFFIVNSTFVIINPYLQVVLDNLGFGVESIGIFIAIFETCGIFGPLVIGFYANKKNWYNQSIIFSLIICSLTFFALSYVESYLSAIILLVLTGFFFRAIPSLLDYVMNSAVNGDSNKYTKMRSAGTLGYVVISALLSLARKPDVSSNKSIGFWFIVICIASIIVVLFIPKTKKIEINDNLLEKNLKGKWYDKGFIITLILLGINRFTLSGVYSFLSLYSIKVVGYTDLTTLNLIGTITEFFVMILSGYLIQNGKVKAVNLMIFSCFMQLIRLSIYALFPTVGFLFFAQALHCFSFGSIHAAAIAYINKHIRIDKKGVAISMYYALASGLPSVLSSIIGGFIVGKYGFTNLFGIYTIICTIPIIIGITFYKTLNKETEYNI